jgi:hypothetical protein
VLLEAMKILLLAMTTVAGPLGKARLILLLVEKTVAGQLVRTMETGRLAKTMVLGRLVKTITFWADTDDHDRITDGDNGERQDCEDDSLGRVSPVE